jgi:hypothetical protein
MSDGRAGAETLKRALVVALTVGALASIARVQPAMARTTHVVKERDDLYALPPPDELRALTLGYHSAAVDLLWTKMLVEYGTHLEEKRPFPDVTHYLDAMLALEPDYRPAYRYADTLLFYHSGDVADAHDVALIRGYMNRAFAARPYDGALWMQYGQFLAFTAVSVMPDSQRDALQAEGARLMARGIELGAETSRVLSVATLLDRNGARAAAIDDLHRSYALTDDPDTREKIAARLASLEGKAQRDDAERAMKRVETHWREDFAFLSRGEYLLTGPVIDPLACAGTVKSGRPECALDWSGALREAASDKP